MHDNVKNAGPWVRECGGIYVRGEQSIMRIGPRTWALNGSGWGPGEYCDRLADAKVAADQQLDPHSYTS